MRSIATSAAINGAPALTRKMLQMGFTLTMTSWVIFGLNGRRIAKMIEAGTDRTFDAAAFEFGAGESGGGSSDSPSGVADTLTDAVAGGGWPTDLQDWAAGLAFAESSGVANVVNCWDSNWYANIPSIGLFQVILPTAQSVDSSATREKLLDPIYNAGIAYKVYQAQGAGPWAGRSTSGKGGTSVTNQTPNTDWGAYCVYG